MAEVEWVKTIAHELSGEPWLKPQRLRVETNLKLAYSCEILTYATAPVTPHTIQFATDLAIVEDSSATEWKPRVVVEAKLGSITTHDAITYSQKAAVHRAVHPYLRYGVMLGRRNDHPLPGRLYRHGAQFDFMISFRAEQMTNKELSRFVELLRAEVAASRKLEEILYGTRKRDRSRYTLLHRQLRVE